MQLILCRDIKRHTKTNDEINVDNVLDATADPESDALWANFEATERELVFA